MAKPNPAETKKAPERKTTDQKINAAFIHIFRPYIEKAMIEGRILGMRIKGSPPRKTP